MGTQRICHLRTLRLGDLHHKPFALGGGSSVAAPQAPALARTAGRVERQADVDEVFL